MAAAIPAMMIASAVVSAAGAMSQAHAASAASNYNAQIATQNASAAAAQGQAASEAQARDSQRKIGSAIAAYGAAGVEAGAGSPSDVLADSSRQATLDNLSTQYNYKLKGLGYTDQAALDKSNASNATTSGYLSAAGSLIGGASKAYGMQQGGGTMMPNMGGGSYFNMG